MRTKLQKLLKIYQNLTFCKFNPNVAKWECFYSHYKKFRCLYLLELPRSGLDKTQIQKVFFWPKLPKFLAKLNFNFLLHNFSRYVIFGIFCNFFARKVLGDMARTRKALQTDGRRDGRTDIHGGKNNICLPQGETYNKTSKRRTVLTYASMCR